MHVHLLDGTYELFRYFYAVPSRTDDEGREIAAARGVVTAVLKMLEEGATHLGVATDHVIESFRNEMWPGYKTGDGLDPDLEAQFPVLEAGLEALGVVVWPMVEHEADDALASAAEVAAADPRVERVLVCSPDKDLAQCVRGERVVQVDRRRDRVRDAGAIAERFGVAPGSIPDYLALVGDSADGFPGIPGFGKVTAAKLLARYRHLEEIPEDGTDWEVAVRGAERLARELAARRDEAELFRDLATLRTDAIELDSVDELEWIRPTDELPPFAARTGASEIVDRAHRLAAARA